MLHEKRKCRILPTFTMTIWIFYVFFSIYAAEYAVAIKKLDHFAFSGTKYCKITKNAESSFHIKHDQN